MNNFRAILYTITVIVLICIMGFILNSLGVFGNIYVERKVFENSYQRTESIKSQIILYNATLTEIEAKLRFLELDENTRNNLEAQAAGIRIKIQAAKEQLR